MRHIVNFGLVISFLALATTGVMAFAFPFAIATTRVHIVFGLATMVLVGLHLAGRVSYFRNRWTAGRQQKIAQLPILSFLLGLVALLVMAVIGWSPIELLIAQSYESRHHAEIVRASPFAGFTDSTRHRRLLARVPDERPGVALSLTIGFAETVESPPSIAVWAETATGAMIETLYLDQALAYSDTPHWGGSATPRNRILPLWRHRYTLVSGIDPNGEVDVVTAATPTHSFTLDDYLVLGEEDTFVLCVEVNAPADANPRYPDPHVGQPSLLYTAYIETDASQRYTLLELTGHGGGAETSGAIHYDLESFTTAKQLIDLLLVKTVPVRDTVDP